jgi:ABC-type nickel/cobalt efflux system permease component RcnA
MLLFAAVVAASLGALHALEPGHGKTVVAAYLVGSRGTAWHAVLLGLIVTASHTAGVYALGGVILYASRHVVPERLYPWLGVGSGVVIAALGVYLFVKRSAGHGHAHDHRHLHDHHTDARSDGRQHSEDHHHPDDDSRPHDHSHDHHHSHGHDHAHPLHAGHHHHELPGDSVSLKQLLTLGITGGIVPCPAALVVLLSGVALRRIGFGLFLIVAFSIGLAAVLVAVGLLMVFAQRFVSRFRADGPLTSRWLPLASSAVVTVLGLAIAVQALVSAGIVPALAG